MTNGLAEFLERRRAGEIAGISSICSSHPNVIEATLRRCKQDGVRALIEATCNQVNQEGGYTGTPRSRLCGALQHRQLGRGAFEDIRVEEHSTPQNALLDRRERRFLTHVHKVLANARNLRFDDLRCGPLR
jgi:hypothetical protein